MGSDFRRVVTFLRRPDIRERLLKSTDEGRPALEGIIRDFETTFEAECDCPGFRATVGKVLKRVMREFGYLWASKGHDVRGARYFTEASRYEKSDHLARTAAGWDCRCMF